MRAPRKWLASVPGRDVVEVIGGLIVTCPDCGAEAHFPGYEVARLAGVA